MINYFKCCIVLLIFKINNYYLSILNWISVRMITYVVQTVYSWRKDYRSYVSDNCKREWYRVGCSRRARRTRRRKDSRISDRGKRAYSMGIQSGWCTPVGMRQMGFPSMSGTRSGSIPHVRSVSFDFIRHRGCLVRLIAFNRITIILYG